MSSTKSSITKNDGLEATEVLSFSDPMSNRNVTESLTLGVAEQSSFLAHLEKRITALARPALAIYWPVLLFLTHMPEQKDIARIMYDLRGYHPDKLLHFATFGLLTILIVFSQLAGKRRSFLTNLYVGCCLAGVYAFFDELTQGIFGRTPSGADLTADLWAVATVFIALLLCRLSELRVTWPILICRLFLIVLVPISGMALFSPLFRIDGMIWRKLPQWAHYVRGDYLCHYLASVLFTLLVAGASVVGVGKRWWNMAFALAFMLISAPLIEALQATYFERSDEPGDLIGHTLGVVTAFVIWLIYQSVHKSLGTTDESVELSEDGERTTNPVYPIIDKEGQGEAAS